MLLPVLMNTSGPPSTRVRGSAYHHTGKEIKSWCVCSTLLVLIFPLVDTSSRLFCPRAVVLYIRILSIYSCYSLKIVVWIGRRALSSDIKPLQQSYKHNWSLDPSQSISATSVWLVDHYLLEFVINVSILLFSLTDDIVVVVQNNIINYVSTLRHINAKTLHIYIPRLTHRPHWARCSASLVVSWILGTRRDPSLEPVRT